MDSFIYKRGEKLMTEHKDKIKRKYAIEEIQYAVDIATGDNGHMANKVTDILESFYD
tara:strand:+ start:25 stop:195 length:171 start_codon:yes stop_codon:yes gene_type:complete